MKRVILAWFLLAVAWAIWEVWRFLVVALLFILVFLVVRRSYRLKVRALR